MLITEEKTEQLVREGGKEFSLPQVEVGIKEMYLSGIHLGYSQTSRNPKMKPYIFGLRNGVEIFDLEKRRRILIPPKNSPRSWAKTRR